ncbi:deacylase [Candidatus Scalindua japonica]|uniref:Deacylase n=1 Tax=Candidatus Scalindua japonica TaxID=1284222 RepID=A0A286U4H8_9BACT|nr:succinylglutamate desuccinylase/aspartoacylase family protein [Candidatus Scalindua japonica]GAX63043.1 deacylase [Candidatus Scalindua japonica]
MSISMTNDIVIGGISIPPGARKRVGIKVAKLYDYTEMTIPVEVLRGKKDGPVLFVSAAIHGDEINGIETIKRLLARKSILSGIRGTLIAVPIINVFGFHQKIRYLPDRRDLNRCFPGSRSGSLGGQIAYIFMEEIVEKCTHGIDLHTGSMHRTNLPQIRASTDDFETKRLALAFGVPVVLNSNLRDGSLRQAAADKNIPMLLFEGGEALRYEEKVIRSALRGIISIMNTIGMIDQKKINLRPRKKEVFVARSSHWIRAPHSGSLRIRKRLGTMVKKDEILGVISDAFGQGRINVRARETGIVIGMNMLPLVNNGDALFHIATFENSKVVEEQVEFFDETLEIDD